MHQTIHIVKIVSNGPNYAKSTEAELVIAYLPPIMLLTYLT